MTDRDFFKICGPLLKATLYEVALALEKPGSTNLDIEPYVSRFPAEYRDSARGQLTSFKADYRAEIGERLSENALKTHDFSRVMKHNAFWMLCSQKPTSLDVGYIRTYHVAEK